MAERGKWVELGSRCQPKQLPLCIRTPRHHINVLGQLLKYIPLEIVDAAAREFGVDTQARTYPVWSHLAAMVFVQLAHALSPNDVMTARNLLLG